MRAPSIIIGVGGIGSYVCAKIAKMMPSNAPDRDMVRFVIMDTDVNTIRDIHRKGFRGIELVLSDNMTVGKCRDIMYERIKNWYPVSRVFDRKSMTEGAGQQRAISRLALEYSINEGKLSPIYRVIQELHELDFNTSNQQITFYIISSLAGGTGSGIVLPLAVHLNRYVLGQQGDSKSGCKGFFIMSSALEDSVDSRLEQQSLNANAYAAVKELSSFMQIEDGDIERYKELEKTFDNDQKPHSYEYCFLFGRRNEKGSGLHSFEDLKDMVANAVYMQACSPMHARNSSREDNKLRHGTMLMDHKGEKYLRRFGGIGCGELCYPRELLTEYYALCWAKEVMQEQWKKYDLMYREKEKEETEKKKRGQKWDIVERGEEYIRAVLSADQQDIFAEEIKASCQASAGGNTWDCYLDALRSEIGRRLDAEKEGNIANPARDERRFYENLCSMVQSQKRSRYMECIRTIKDLYSRIEDSVRLLPTQYKMYLGDTWFIPHLKTDDVPDYYMEYWLMKNGQFIHPNAVRYFLYQLKQAIESRKQTTQDLCESSESRFMGMKGKQIKEYPFRRSDYYKGLAGRYKAAWESLYDYAKEKLYGHILQKCSEYVNKLIKKYENFYDTYQQLLMEFDERIYFIEEALDKKKGVGRVYVCADAACRRKVVEVMKQQKSFVQVDGVLSQYLFQLMWDGKWTKLDDEHKFQNIKEYWINGLEKDYKQMLSPHVLHAMDMEEYYKEGRHMDAEEMKNMIMVVEEVMTAPFVQYWRTDNISKGINICCFNSILNHQQGVFQEVAKWLRDKESVDDEYYCSPYRMVFYHSFVGLNASEVWDYQHGKDDSIPKGAAFVSYETMVGNMGRNFSKENGLTPHTGKNWHNFRYMPDPQKEYQQWKEINIATAFLYAFLSGKIVKNKDAGYGIKIYEMFGIYGREAEGKCLDDCYNILYNNQFLTEELLEEMGCQIASMRKDNKSPLVHFLDGKGLWDLLLEYNQEIAGNEWNVSWRSLMLYSVRLFVEKCIGGCSTQDDIKKCYEELKNEYKKLLDKEMVDEKSRVILREIERFCQEGEM